ncbi:MAG: hypothetical protein M3N18_06025 [Actinomycetota bacterium]|nr:hypothetical protein [Actinomycetota bacterium]
MADPTAIAIAQETALKRVLSVIEKHDPDQAARLRALRPGGAMPHSVKMPNEVMTFLAESVATMVELVDQHIEESQRKRGRPRKAS